MSGEVRLADLVGANPGFERQMRDWQAGRQRGGEDPLDWAAFRAAQAAIGAPDPGEAGPAEFYAFAAPGRASGAAPAGARGSEPAAPLAAAAGMGAGYAFSAADVEVMVRGGQIKKED